MDLLSELPLLGDMEFVPIERARVARMVRPVCPIAVREVRVLDTIYEESQLETIPEGVWDATPLKDAVQKSGHITVLQQFEELESWFSQNHPYLAALIA